MPEAEEYASWLESRRLIIAQLSAMETSIRDLGTRIDHYYEASRDKTAETSKEVQTAFADLNLRVAMLELRAKLWGGVIGLAGGAVATAIVQLLSRALER